MYWGIILDIACLYGSNYLGKLEGYAQAKQEIKMEMQEKQIYDMEREMIELRKKLGL
jgi:hypothetical protein